MVVLGMSRAFLVRCGFGVGGSWVQSIMTHGSGASGEPCVEKATIKSGKMKMRYRKSRKGTNAYLIDSRILSWTETTWRERRANSTANQKRWGWRTFILAWVLIGVHRWPLVCRSKQSSSRSRDEIDARLLGTPRALEGVIDVCDSRAMPLEADLKWRGRQAAGGKTTGGKNYVGF
jgi:hypothetical protein